MSSALKAALEQTAGLHLWETFEFPSLGRFYDGEIPAKIQIRAMTGEEEKCIDAGCNYVLFKPINRTELIETVSRYA